MGCTFDCITIKIKQEEKVQAFIDLFNSIIKEDLYDEDLELDMSYCEQEDDMFVIGIEDEPLFHCCEYGEQLLPLFEQFLKENPDVGFEATYECTFSNCGDMVFNEYTYEDGVLVIKSKHSEFPYLTNCPECGYEAEEDNEIMTLNDWQEGMVCVCPECKAEIPYEASVDINRIVIVE